MKLKLLNLQNLAAFVVSASLAGFMRPDCSSAVWTNGQWLLGKMVMCASLVSAWSGFMLLWYTHCFKCINYRLNFM